MPVFAPIVSPNKLVSLELRLPRPPPGPHKATEAGEDMERGEVAAVVVVLGVVLFVTPVVV